MNGFRLTLRLHRRHAPGLILATAALAVLIAQHPASAQELGRLFFTPEQRQMLDYQRQSPAATSLQEEVHLPEDPTLTINGVVTRSSGKRTVWINGIAQNETGTASGITVSPLSGNPGKVIVQPDKSPTARSQVGATINRTTGESVDIIGDGQIRSTAIPPTP